MAQSGSGRIRLFNDFCGPEIPIATAVAYGTSAGGCNYYLGDFTVRGTLEDTACGVISVAKASGYARLATDDDTDGLGIWVGSELVFSPVLNGTLTVEARLEMPALTARVVFVGFMGTLADATAEPLRSSVATFTAVASHYCGFLFDSQLTTDQNEWHMPYLGGSTTGPTVSTDVDSGVVAVAEESDVLRLEIDSDGTARWYINGDLKQTVAGAVSTTTLQAGGVGIWNTSAVTGLVDVDYLEVTANRDWTR